LHAAEPQMGIGMTLLAYVCKEKDVSEFEGQGMILAGKVFVNQSVCTSIKQEIGTKDVVDIHYKEKKYATRSGLKLEKALEEWHVDVADKICIDIGASGGGFTDCLLQHGARKVYAVDVAYGILNWKLRTDPRVVVLDRTNARFLTKKEIPERCDILTADVSFISISKILPVAKALLAGDGQILSLYKPQFELPKHQVEKNGNVSNPQFIVDSIVRTVTQLGTEGVLIRRCTYSPIIGNNGNIEFLLAGDLNSENAQLVTEDDIMQVITAAYQVFHREQS
jgi:23S rRNA (cytidine1920-2'-O)/16S rRNA (cytidine1409-2'-O)-methyltransferase